MSDKLKTRDGTSGKTVSSIEYIVSSKEKKEKEKYRE